jgi:hypothetical protein
MQRRRRRPPKRWAASAEFRTSGFGNGFLNDVGAVVSDGQAMPAGVGDRGVAAALAAGTHTSDAGSDGILGADGQRLRTSLSES